jgi:hypothetical protein
MGAVSRAFAALEQRPRLVRALGIAATLLVLEERVAGAIARLP